MKATSGNINFIGIQVLFITWFLCFLGGYRPIWLHAAAILATLLFIGIMEKEKTGIPLKNKDFRG